MSMPTTSWIPRETLDRILADRALFGLVRILPFIHAWAAGGTTTDASAYVLAHMTGLSVRHVRRLLLRLPDVGPYTVGTKDGGWYEVGGVPKDRRGGRGYVRLKAPPECFARLRSVDAAVLWRVAQLARDVEAGGGVLCDSRRSRMLDGADVSMPTLRRALSRLADGHGILTARTIACRGPGGRTAYRLVADVNLIERTKIELMTLNGDSLVRQARDLVTPMTLPGDTSDPTWGHGRPYPEVFKIEDPEEDQVVARFPRGPTSEEPTAESYGQGPDDPAQPPHQDKNPGTKTISYELHIPQNPSPFSSSSEPPSSPSGPSAPRRALADVTAGMKMRDGAGRRLAARALIAEAAAWTRDHAGSGLGLTGRVLVGVCLHTWHEAVGMAMPIGRRGSSLEAAVAMAQARLDAEAEDDPEGGWRLAVDACRYWRADVPKYGRMVTVESLFGDDWESKWTLPMLDSRRPMPNGTAAGRTPPPPAPGTSPARLRRLRNSVEAGMELSAADRAWLAAAEDAALA